MQGAAPNDKEETMTMLDVVESQKELSATEGVKKSLSKKLDFTHLQSTLDTISKKTNFMPKTLEVQPSIPVQQAENKEIKNHFTVNIIDKRKLEVQGEPSTQGLNNPNLTKVGTDELKRKLDAIRNMNNSVSTSVSQEWSYAYSTQPTINQGQQQIIQVTHDRTKKMQPDTTLPSSNTTPQAEDLMSEQDGSRKEKNKPSVRATTIDEFLKENGIDVKINGLSSELTDDMGDDFPLDENYYSHEEFQNRQAADETDEEAFESLFGKDQPRRVRCYGKSVTRSDLKKHAEISEIKQRHQEEVTSLKAELGDMKAKQQHQEAELHGLRNFIKLLVQRSEPGMRPEEIEALLQNAQHSPIDANSTHGTTQIPNIDMDNSEDVSED
ncbi:hypothetical protein Ahy_B08g090447 [Arachis hypogaea]|uniref:Uncharacterized protein n=1 Tax=Arachis hypogaea TaxID=3818 RepID=A0A444Y0A1_ARAHY|nr:hypothetical protein Ahy_B08g090447 [Arachis hypogaea]